MGAFIRRHATLILFVIVIAGLSGAFVRTNRLIEENKQLAVTAQQITIQLEATVKQRRIEICSGEVSTRSDLKFLLLRLTDLLPAARRAEFEQRIHEALDPPPDACPPP